MIGKPLTTGLIDLLGEKIEIFVDPEIARLIDLNDHTNKKFGPFTSYGERGFKLQEEHEELIAELRKKDLNFMKIIGEAIDVQNVSLTIIQKAVADLKEERKKWNKK